MEPFELLVANYRDAKGFIENEMGRIASTFPHHLMIEAINRAREERNQAAVKLADAVLEGRHSQEGDA